MEESGDPGARIAVDAHVHLHAEYDLAGFLEGARANLASAAGALALPPEKLPALLCLTEDQRRDRFAELVSIAGEGSGRIAGFRLALCQEEGAVVCVGDRGQKLILLAGRQIVTGERIEVLAIATPHRFIEGRPLEETIEAVGASGAIPVLPWGAGKWSGRRGKIVTRMLAVGAPDGADAPERWWLGDTANRPAGGSCPGPFRLGTARGRWILPGTDPLPLRGHQGRSGRYGFLLRGRIDPDRPLSDLRRRIRSLDAQPPCFGRRVGWARFLADQLALRLKRRGSRA